MAIDYSVAGEWADHVRALAIIESKEDETAVGDGGRAFGLLQMHPGRFLDEAYHTGAYRITPSDTWSEAQIKCAANYFARTHPNDLALAVQAWNLGTHAVFVAGKRNPEYYTRWANAFEWIAGRKIYGV